MGDHISFSNFRRIDRINNRSISTSEVSFFDLWFKFLRVYEIGEIELTVLDYKNETNQFDE